MNHIKILGGKCELCGYDKCTEALDIHHLDPTKKEKHLWGWKMRKELDYSKVILICSNCHRELHYNERLNKVLK